MTESTKSVIVREGFEIAGKTLLSLIPVGGALATAVWDSLKNTVAEKRAVEWRDMIECRLSNVEMTLDELADNEIFVSAMIQATETAMKTAEKQKREYLANAVYNSISCDLDECKVMMFVDWINRYTMLHLRILNYFDNPRAYAKHNYSMGAPMTALLDAFPDLKSEEALVTRVVRELYNDGLMSTDNLNITMTDNGILASRTTKLGREFIGFLRKDE